jgi:hypothetical protein
VEGLAAEATRKASRRKYYPLTNEQKSEKARVEVERRSVIKLNVEQKSEKASTSNIWDDYVTTKTRVSD